MSQPKATTHYNNVAQMDTPPNEQANFCGKKNEQIKLISSIFTPSSLILHCFFLQASLSASLPLIFLLCARRILMSRLCAACHKVQSLTQHIHQCESCELVSTTLMSQLQNKSRAFCESHHTLPRESKAPQKQGAKEGCDMMKNKFYKGHNGRSTASLLFA